MDPEVLTERRVCGFKPILRKSVSLSLPSDAESGYVTLNAEVPQPTGCSPLGRGKLGTKVE